MNADHASKGKLSYTDIARSLWRFILDMGGRIGWESGLTHLGNRIEFVIERCTYISVF